MAVTYILCAAGEGSRFRDYFGTLPKAMIELYGSTLLEWSLRSLPICGQDRLVIITQKKHRVKEKMEQKIAMHYPFSSVVWLEIDALTRGQLETASFAFEHILPESSVVIYNCDTYFESRTLLGKMNDPQVQGIIPCAQAQGDSWSFCEVDEHDRVLQVREKERISEWASVGLYYFKDAVLFCQRALHALAQPQTQTQQGEYYVAPLYQTYLDAGECVLMDRVSLFKPMGTPQQLEAFWEVDVKQLAVENLAPVLVVDLDNTITIDEPGVSYAMKKPNRPVITRLREFERAGWQIIIYTSRRMETFQNNEARIVAEVGQTTMDWLEVHQVPYHGIRFGKPYARFGFYVDDKAMHPDEFIHLSPEQALEKYRK